MKSFNRNLVTIYAKQEFLDWVKEVQPELHRWDLKTINHRPTAYMIEIEDQNCHGMVLKNYYKSIIENELSNHLYISKESWPQSITFDLFTKWFTYQYHEEINDLCETELNVFDE